MTSGSLTRRDALRAVAAVGAASVVLNPGVAEAATPSWVVPLLERATYGATPASIAAATQLPSAAAWLDQQLAPARLADPEGDDVRRLYPELGWSIASTRAHTPMYAWEAMFALGQATISLACWSRRQLFELMVELWSNHLNVTNPSDRAWDNRGDYDRTVLRRFALGRFSDLLVASASHPAMLTYLNQADSTKARPNENYARELLELHTVGVDHFTEQMVQDAARLLTGWTVDDAGQAVYDASNHATGPVRVLGFTHDNASPDGRAAVTAMLRYLASHPLTAQRIARKIAVRFLSDAPTQAQVDALARTYLAHGTDVRPVVKQALTMPRGRKLKTPYEDLVSTVRVLGVRLLPASKPVAARRSGPEALWWIAGDLRNAPGSWTLPDGYPDTAVAWQAADTLLRRWNMHQGLAAAWWPGHDRLAIPASRSLLPARLPTTYGALVDVLSLRLLNRRLDGASRAAVLRFCGAASATALPASSEWLGWRLPHLVALLLDTPAFAERS